MNKLKIYILIFLKKIGVNKLLKPFRKLEPDYYQEGNILLEKYKTIYFPIAKAACTSFKKVFAGELGLAVKGDNPEEMIHRLEFPFARREEFDNKYKDYFKFAVVRNPFSRLVSVYLNKVVDFENKTDYRLSPVIECLKRMGKYKKGISFADFVKAVVDIPDEEIEGHLCSQYFYLINEKGDLIVDFVARFENLDHDLLFIKEKMNFPGLDLPHLMKTKHKDWRDYYNEDLRRLVEERYKKDLDIFSYKFDI